MGLCENFSVVDDARIDKNVFLDFSEKPMNAEQGACLDVGCGLLDAFGVCSGEPSRCLDLPQDDNAGCLLDSGDVMETFNNGGDGLKSDLENEFDSWLKNSVDQEDNSFEIDAHEAELHGSCSPRQGDNRWMRSFRASELSSGVTLAAEFKDSNNFVDLPVVMEGDATGEIGGEECKSSSENGEIPSEASQDLTSSFHRETDDKADQSISDICGGIFEDVSEIKSKQIMLLEEVAPGACLTDLEKSYEADLLSDSSQKNEQMYDEKEVGFSAQSIKAKGESDATTGTKTDVCEQLSLIEEDACSLNEDSFNNGCSEELDVPDRLETDVDGVLTSNHSVDCFRSIDDEGKRNAEAASTSGGNCPDTVSSYSRRRSRESKLSEKTRTRKNTVSSRRGTKHQQSQENLNSIRAVRRKRSCFSKPARSSLWGRSGDMTNIFTGSNDPVSNQDLVQGTHKSSSIQSNEKENRNQITGNRQGSNRENNGSRNCIRLKVKFGKPGALKSLILKFPGNQDCSLTEMQDEDKDLELNAFSGKSAGEVGDDITQASNIVAEACLEANENIHVHSSTSPDSEVINPVSGAFVGARDQEDLCSIIFSITETAGMNGEKGKKKGLKKESHHCTENGTPEDGLLGSSSSSKSTPLNNSQDIQKMDKSFNPSEILSSTISGEVLSNSSSGEKLSTVALPLPRESAESQSSENVLSSIESKDHKLPKSLKSQEARKGRLYFSDSNKNRRGKKSGHRANKLKSVSLSGDTEKHACDQALDRAEFHQGTDYHGPDDVPRTNLNPPNEDLVSHGAAPERRSFGSAWVRCDDCHKWRRIPDALVESIDGNFRWTCKDNSDKAFADCLIFQEKSNEEINAELGISDAEADAFDRDLKHNRGSKKSESRWKPGSRKPSFRGIKCNQFLHRTRKAQTIDEVMVCYCKPPPDGQLGCGDECLNRMLNIECAQGACPCGDCCSNQQFQQRKYKEVELFRAGKKGHGLRALENMRKGQFIVEYVGEVLDMRTYDARLKEYAANGQKHFYFMTLNGTEVIDAGVKGNLGRFINHSCDPNCRTEKWMVNGEICIGIFALRDIKKEEELTFDYNYVRIFGAAVKKCYCGASQCRGYIGGDPLNSEVVIQSDSDEEYENSMMPEEDVTGDETVKAKSRTSLFDNAEIQVEETPIKEIEKKDDSNTTVCQVDVTTEMKDSKGHYSSSICQLEDVECTFSSFVQPLEVSPARENETSKAITAIQQDITKREMPSRSACHIQTSETSASGMDCKSASGEVDTSKSSKYASVEDKKILQQSRPIIKTSRSSGPGKKGKSKNNSPNCNKVQKIEVNKLQIPSTKCKTSTETCSNGRTEAVEEKLNELLDSEGGISKRKDATKGYLKLLLLTAASRGSASSEAIQSNRDLSMILDALLKTKSRAVLVDIINKNGLQMLHNIIKQYRRDFKKIPILRKIMKVLEYLAARDVVREEHIIRGPPCRGMESFRESLLSLTEHDDKQVHQSARNFRDRWIPRPFRRIGYMDRTENMMLESHRYAECSRFSTLHHSRDKCEKPAEPVVSATESKVDTSSESNISHKDGPEPENSISMTKVTKQRKRKSRWDQPAERPDSSQYLPNKEQKIESSLPQLPCQTDEAICSNIDKLNKDENAPPGFSCPSDGPSDLPSTVSNNIVAQPQEKFISRLPVSYGIPLTIIQQFGSPCTEEIADSWVVAPGVPFHPFPPLPPVPRHNREEQQQSHGHTASWSGDKMPNTNMAMDVPSSMARPGLKRTRESSSDLGRRHFRQQKWNIPPWIRKRCGNIVGNSFKGRGNGCGIQVGNVENEVRNS